MSGHLDVPAVFERYAAAWAAHDPDAILALHSPDTTFWLHLDQPAAHGHDAVRAVFVHLFDAWPELGIDVHRLLTGADHWTLDWTLVSVLTDPGGARRPVRIRCVDLVTPDADGLVSRKDSFVDHPQALRALAPG